MKTLKPVFLLAIMLTVLNTFAQDNKSYWVHEDQVKPSMTNEYEKVSKDFVDVCVKYNLQDSDWATAQVDNGNYLYITEIKNMADLDKNTLAPLEEKMGADNFTAIFKRFNKCYDKHGDYIVHLSSDLSYMPNGLTTNTEGLNYRKWHFLYVTPENIENLRNKLKELKALYEKKGSKEYFRIYRAGFGTMGDYFLATISAKNAQDYARQSDENDVLLGEEGKKLFDEMFKYVYKYESETGNMRPDLSYMAK